MRHRHRRPVECAAGQRFAAFVGAAARDARGLRGERGRDRRPRSAVPPEGEHTTVAAQLSVSLTRGSNVLLALWHQLNDIASLPYPSATKENQIPCRYVTTVSHRTESLADLVSEAVRGGQGWN